MTKNFRTLPAILSAAMLALAAQSALAADGPVAVPGAAAQAPFLAVVNGKTITAGEFETAANEAARQKFYHATPPEGAVDQLVRDVANSLVNRVLLLEEADRRRVKPDAKAVQAKLDQYERRYSTSERWKQEREAILPALRERLEQDSVVERLEADVRRLPPPTEDKVRAYYKANPEKFTEPEKMRLSMILISVDPASPTSAWQAAEAEAAELLKRLKAGAKFAELAKAHSAHESAEQGGDLGYLHRGMLPDGIQEKIDAMKPGELSVPTRILQGYAVFRYEALQKPKHHEFATVRQRATDLLARDQAEQAWSDFTAGLRKKAKIELNTERYQALANGAR